MITLRKRKAFAALGLIAALAGIALPVETVQAAEEVPGVSSVCYLAMDADTGEVLAEKNADVTVGPASTTKLVTAMVICDVLPMDTPITVTQEQLDRVPAGTSKAGVKAGGTYYAYELLAMLLIPSGADAAQVLAETAYGSTDACVTKMNEKVTALGLSNTYFDNIYGLDIGNGYPLIHTTARDFAVITQTALTYDWIRMITSMPQYALPARTNNDVIGGLNTNQFLTGKRPYSANLYQVIGTKTGTTKTAGSVLAATATNGKRTVICTCFYNPNADVLYDSVKRVFDYVYLKDAAGTE